jgi:hypothetical protein
VLQLRQRLLEHGCEVTEIIDHGLMRALYFTDPKGAAAPPSLTCSYRASPLLQEASELLD